MMRGPNRGRVAEWLKAHQRAFGARLGLVLRAPSWHAGGVAEWLKAHQRAFGACLGLVLRAPSRRRWRGGRVAEGARLESVFTGNRNVGSNPTPSARTMDA
jgi:hypothetical protein